MFKSLDKAINIYEIKGNIIISRGFMKRFYNFLVLSFFSSITLSQGVWVEQPVNPTPPPLNSVSAVNTNVCWVAGGNGNVLYTSNGGTNWVYRNVPGFNGSPTYVIAGIDSITALCSITTTQFTYIFRTTNQGNSWTQIYSHSYPGWIDDIKIINPSLAVAIGDPIGGRWTFLRILNLGAFIDTTVFLPQIGSEFAWFNSMFTNGTDIWFGTSSSRIYHSTNQGFNWVNSSVQYPNVYAVCFNGILGFAGGDQMAKSSNSGFNWTPVTLPGNGTCLTFVTNSGRYWYARTNQIFFSSDGGNSFVAQHSSPDNSNYVHLSFTFSLSDEVLSTIHGWGITGNGVISYYTESGIGIRRIGTEVPDRFALLQNYPNPFNPTTSIEYQLQKSGHVSIRVFDEIGKQVQALVDEFQPSGYYRAEWNASNLSSGVYYYRIESPYFSQTRKMVLSK